MRYALILDIHATPSAIKKVLLDAQVEKAEKIVCLGYVERPFGLSDFMRTHS